MHAAPGKNHFTLFGLAVSFDLDIDDLSVRYRDMQRRVHPDKFANATGQERRLSLQMTALINEAFQTLKDPVSRGRYLLNLRGIDLGDETDTHMNRNFLMEQMEFRENLDDLKQAGNPRERLAELKNRIEKRWKQGIENFRRVYEANTSDTNAQARDVMRELQFLEKMRVEIDRLEEELI